eukprot:TRINITY_DN48251_c0_g1_i1.p1 TRINITY_DN48251_c0_g1~~TRINITY_DN48251_c0_g1_i1.p1  ORF type:complete len:510 (-),score=102.94 TRINITY_DN48251_c0_g1_i1:112-1641(-)
MRCASVALLVVTAWAQIYRFEEETVPESKSLVMKTVFFVISKNDTGGNESKVTFTQLFANSTSQSRPAFTLREYVGIQLHLMRYEDFGKFVKADKMCSTADDVAKGYAEKEDQLILHTGGKDKNKKLDDLQVSSYEVRFYGLREHGHADLEKNITRTGVYVLVLSNCGTYDKATISGNVYVKNPYGYLPGDEIAKLRLFKISSVVYVVLLAVWLLLCLRWYSVLSRFHVYILAVIALGLAECIVCYMSLSQWNSTGLKTHQFFRPLVLLSATRTSSSYVMVLLASLGWGMSRQELNTSTVWKMSLLAVIYTALNCIREIMGSSSQSLAPSQNLVLFCFVPLSLLHGATFYWIFSALSCVIEELRSMGQTEQLSIFQQLWRVLLCAVGFALLSVLVQVFVFSQDALAYWRQQWLVTDLAPHLVFSFVLVVIMLLWAPSEDTPRNQFMQIDGTGKGDKVAPGADGSIWTDEAMEGDDDDSSFWASSKQNAEADHRPVPEVLGHRRGNYALE